MITAIYKIMPIYKYKKCYLIARLILTIIQVFTNLPFKHAVSSNLNFCIVPLSKLLTDNIVTNDIRYLHSHYMLEGTRIVISGSAIGYW